MMQNPERLISREELLREVWGYRNYPRTRTVDTHMLKLRQKLERDPSDPVHFKTVHSFGYKFARQDRSRIANGVANPRPSRVQRRQSA
jgi:DNA-binding response OmpR family regulator